MNTRQLKAALKKKHRERKLKPSDYLSTGSTVLNLACSGRRGGAFVKGTFVLVVGDSASGKTFLTCTSLAEAANNPAFDNYRLILIDAERGALFDFRRFFGSKMAARLEVLTVETIDELYDLLDDLHKAGKPFIAIVDSMDVLTSDQENEKFEEQKTDRRRGRQTTGSMGDGKAKKNSANLRRVVSHLKKTDSILIAISQTRDNIGFGAQFNPKTRSGGKALRFYAALELWSSIKGTLKKPHKGSQKKVGIICQVQVKKNRLTGRDRTVEFPIYYSVGIDDIGGCVDYLVTEGHWKKTDGKIVAPEFKDGSKKSRGTRDGLIQHIEETNQETDLRRLVADVWDEAEDALEVKRKSRYE